MGRRKAEKKRIIFSCPSFRKRFEAASRLKCGDITTVAEDGKQRSMLCIPLKKLPAYLNSINASGDWSKRRTKSSKKTATHLKAASRLRCYDIATPSEGGVRSMLCIPLKKLPAYLNSINASEDWSKQKTKSSKKQPHTLKPRHV